MNKPINSELLYNCNSNRYYILIVSFILLASCQPSREEQARKLYDTHCASCHIAPQIQDLPRQIWAEKILPEMGARLGIRDEFDPLQGLTMDEQFQVIQSGAFPPRPMIKQEDWELLRDYIISQAPDSLAEPASPSHFEPLSQFLPRPLSLDSIRGSMITYMDILDDTTNVMILGEMGGKLTRHDFTTGISVTLGRYGRGITGYSKLDSIALVTAVGYLEPSEIAAGRILKVRDGQASTIPEEFHRPVHTNPHDLNGDGRAELLVSEFGDLRGSLSLLEADGSGNYRKRILLQQPGVIRTVIRDMDNDGLEDVLVLTSQGDEGITVIYQTAPLEFEAKKILRFSPVYGSSWFEVLDYEGDGDLDIITVHGDNADKSYVHKPYHGMRIFLNEGDSNFEEAYFFPFHGATRVIASDMDQDGDVDFSLLSTFPPYESRPVRAFAYLENKDAGAMEFQAYTLDITAPGHWFLMDAGDVDKDGDTDVVLSSFTYYFSPVPEDLKALWANSFTDIMVLENTLYNARK